MMAFKVAGNRGAYDVVDDFDMKEYMDSLPLYHDPIDDVQTFKDFEAMYFTPSNLKEGLARKKDNIADIQAIIFDLDNVESLHDLDKDMVKMSKVDLEFHAWQTPSSIGNGQHHGGMRLYIPLKESIEPRLLPQAVDELMNTLNQVLDVDLNKYGADITASKTIARLMGLPLQNYLTFSWYGSKKYKVNAKYVEPKKATQKRWCRDFSQRKLVTNRGESPETFVRDYMKKHNIPDLILGVNVHNTLQQLSGALAKAGFNEEQALEGLEFLSDVPTNGMADIEKEIITSNAFKK